jgi:hypothetical protein
MKKLYFLITVLIFASCATMRLTDQPEYVIPKSFDFRTYAEKGFLFTPESFLGEYSTMGIVEIQFHPAIRYRDGQLFSGHNYTARQLYLNGKIITQMASNINTADVIDQMYRVAVEMGGDAVTNFRLVQMEGLTDGSNPNSFYDYYKISGVIIKRGQLSR